MGNCVVCGTELAGRRRKYCGPECARRQARSDWVLRTYGLTLAELDTIWEYQGRRCAICGRSPRPGETFHVDHEHRVGQSGPIRGILCPYCNTRLVGRLKSAERAQALADYLREKPAVAALGRVVVAPGRQPRRRKRRRNV